MGFGEWDLGKYRFIYVELERMILMAIIPNNFF
jgi:hypothetical protein